MPAARTRPDTRGRLSAHPEKKGRLSAHPEKKGRLSAHPELIVCSHRGPFVYERSGDRFVGRRGGGGLIGAVAPVLEQLGGTWIAAALSDGDREVARDFPKGRDEEGFRLRLLDLPADVHGQHYDVVSNEHLWFLFHYLFDVPSEPRFDDDFWRAWDAYHHVNELYTRAVTDTGTADAIIVHDYHLMLVGSMLRAARVRKPIVYFHHIPWCQPDYFSILPEALAQELLHAMLAYDVVGFHAARWADAFRECCARFLPGAKVTSSRVTWRKRSARVVVTPVPLDVENLDRSISDPETARWADAHDEMRAGRKLLLRVDRIDLSKNPLRGFHAFEHLLDMRKGLADEVVFLALLYPSRQSSEPYRRYYTDCLGLVRRINERFGGSKDDGPIQFHFSDDYHRSLGALQIYDALLVNPVFDGLNLVAKEGAYANTRAGSLLLSRNAGVFEELGKAAVPVNPFDITQTADAMAHAIEMPQTTRERNARTLRRLAAHSSPVEWVGAQLKAAGVSI